MLSSYEEGTFCSLSCYTLCHGSYKLSRGISLKLRLIAGVTILFVLVAGAISMVLFGPALLSQAGNGIESTDTGPLTSATGDTTGNVIARENAQPGTISWIIPNRKAATTQIQAYASATSVQEGQLLSFYVSTQVQGMR